MKSYFIDTKSSSLRCLQISRQCIVRQYSLLVELALVLLVLAEDRRDGLEPAPRPGVLARPGNAGIPRDGRLYLQVPDGHGGEGAPQLRALGDEGASDPAERVAATAEDVPETKN